MSDILLLAAMAEETAPVLAGHDATQIDVPHGRAWHFGHGAHDVTLVTCGIGLVSSAAATALAIERYVPSHIVSLGSAGGLGVDVRVGDIIVGSAYRYADADATAFGYEIGQIPSMPVSYPGDPRMLEIVAADRSDVSVHCGEIVSGNSFVAGDITPVVRERFPEALAADMESAAIAQVAWGRGIPFVSVRSISDLCGPAADEDFRGSIHDVAQRSAAAVWRLVDAL